VVWLNVCSETGLLFNHSIEVGIDIVEMYDRVEEAPSQIIHINKITAKNEIKLPSEDTIFQGVKASG
jgi:hypothetical protein